MHALLWLSGFIFQNTSANYTVSDGSLQINKTILTGLVSLSYIQGDQVASSYSDNITIYTIYVVPSMRLTISDVQ